MNSSETVPESAGVSDPAYRRKVLLGDVARENCRLRCQEKKSAGDRLFFRRKPGGDRRFAGIEMRQQSFDYGILDPGGFLAGMKLLLQTLASSLERGQISQDELGVNDFNVADRVDARANVVDIWIFKATHHLYDRVHLADVMQKLVPESFPGTRPFDQAGDIEKLNCGRRDLLRMRNRGNFFQPRVRHRDHAEIGINRAEGIIFRRRFMRAGDGIEESRFPDVRQSHNASAKHPLL